MTNQEKKELIIEFMNWLMNNTDTFDPFMVNEFLNLEDKESLKFNQEEVQEFAELFLSGK